MMATIEELLDIVTPEDAQPPSARSIRSVVERRRARRRSLAVAAVVLLMVAGTLAVVAQRFGLGDSDSMRIESVVEPDEDESDVDRDKGQSLVLSSAAPEGVPPAIGQLVSDGQRFFVLEATPGEPTGFRREVGYIYDGVSWAEGLVGGRFITSEIQSDGDGLLYVLSESFGGPLPELGRSYDGGLTWDWMPIEADFVPFEDSVSSSFGTTRVTSSNGVQLVVLTRPALPHHEEARALVSGATGIDIDDLGNEASYANITPDGVELVRVPDSAFVLSACDEALSLAWQDVDGSGSFDPAQPDVALDPTTIAQAFESARVTDDCEQRAECAISVAVRQVAAADLIDRIRESSLPAEAWGAVVPASDAGFECASELEPYGRRYDTTLETTEYITWEEMGVTTPDSWRGEVVGVRIEGSTMTDLGPLFPLEDRSVVGVESDGTGFRVATSPLARSGDDEEGGMVWKADPELGTWASKVIDSEGLAWISSDPWGDGASVGFGPERFRIVYRADQNTPAAGDDLSVALAALRSTLVRRDDNGSYTRWMLADLAPALDGNYVMKDVAVGSMGVAVVAAPVDNSSELPEVLFVSVDSGETWLHAAVDDGFVHQLAVGSDAIMLAVSGSVEPRSEPITMVVGTVQ